MILTNNKITDYRIVIPANPTESQRYAGDELAKYLELMGGARLPVVCDCTEPVEKEIVIGKTNREGTPCGCGLKHDGYIYRTVGEKLFILGENDRGNLYGVYQLLENELGCRFLAEGVEKIPTRNTLKLPELDKTVIPPLEYRETYWYAAEEYPDTAIKRGFNASCFKFKKFEPKHGGDVRYWGFSHTMFRYVHPDEYFDEHPEYFSMINGERIREHTQLCLTNPEVLEITKRKLRQNIIDHPECKIFGLTQMDWYNPCQCPECAKVDEEEGSHAGTMIRFVNACAESIAEEFPDILIDTFAYQYTRQPPKLTKPLPNVCVRICSIECCFSHPLRECNETAHFKDRTKAGATFQDDMRGWAKICNRIFVWDYTTNFAHYLNPMTNLHVLQDNMKFFLENGVTGLFEQGNGESTSGELGELRAYVISKLMWNPDIDVSETMNDFLGGYYGSAAAPIRAYIDMLTKHVVENHVHVGIYCDPKNGHIPEELLVKAEALFDRAEKLADNEAILARVQKSRLQIRYVRLFTTPVEDPGYAAMAEALIADVHRFGLTRVREWQPMDVSESRLRAGISLR